MFLKRISGLKYKRKGVPVKKEVSFLAKGFVGDQTLKQFFSKISGIQYFFLRRFLLLVGLPERYKIGYYATSNLLLLEENLNLHFITNLYLQKACRDNIKRKRDINCFQGYRHKVGLPVNGQSARTNGKTARRLLSPFKIKVNETVKKKNRVKKKK